MNETVTKMHDDDVTITLTIPRAMANDVVNEARALSREVGGPPIQTHTEAVRAMLIFGLNTALCQRALQALEAAQAKREHVERGGTQH